jgi:hypothetical protein
MFIVAAFAVIGIGVGVSASTWNQKLTRFNAHCPRFDPATYSGFVADQESTLRESARLHHAWTALQKTAAVMSRTLNGDCLRARVELVP